MTKGKGYLLPAGDAQEDELECCLVFYPARDEYRRALMGSLDYLATWIAWERDSGKRGKDAAASWKLANIQTWECCSMGYCDDLLTTLEALLAATTALECCGEQDITDGRQYTDEIVDGVGDVPQNIIDAGYATGVSDWDGFDDYKCMISHLAVDHIETFFREISPFISDTGLVIGGIGVVGALLGAILVVVGLPISAGILVALGAAAGIWSWISKYGRDAVDDLAEDIATNHDALACAIYQGDGVSDAIDDFNAEVDSLFSTIDATAIKAVGFEPQLRAMYAGRYDQEDIAANLEDLGYAVIGYDCSSCDDVEPAPTGYHLEYPGTETAFGWSDGCVDNGSTYDPVTGILVLSFSNTSSNTIEFWVTLEDPTNLAQHGYKLTLLGRTMPSHLSTDTPASESPVQGTRVIYYTGSGAWDIGQRLAGYNEVAHSGAEWDDWAEQYENVSHWASGYAKRVQFHEYPSNTGLIDDYSMTFRVEMLVVD